MFLEYIAAINNTLTSFNMAITLDPAQEQAIITQLLERVNPQISKYVKENMVHSIKELANQDDSIFDTTAYSPSALDDDRHNSTSQLQTKIEELEIKLKDCQKTCSAVLRKCKITDNIISEQQSHLSKKSKDIKSSITNLQSQLNVIKPQCYTNTILKMYGCKKKNCKRN